MPFTMTKRENLPYRPCVGIALFNEQGKVFVGERIDTPGAWQMPQGGIDDGEDAIQACFREMEEEIGTRKARILQVCDETTCYDLPSHLLGRLWNGQYRGQEQVWVAALFQGRNSDIDITAHKPAEFRNWQWVELSELLELIVPFKRDTYKQVIAHFNNFTDPENLEVIE